MASPQPSPQERELGKKASINKIIEIYAGLKSSSIGGIQGGCFFY